jgi:hypothetical protein
MNISRRLFVATLLCLFNAWCPAETATGPKTVRLLTVGNSFAGNATHYLGDLAKAAGHTLILRGANVGGASLELHWTKVQAFEKDPTAKLGRYASGKSLEEELRAQPWDFVTIQQASVKSHDLSTYRPYAKLLADYIHRHAPKATLLLHQTWEYRVDDARFSKAPVNRSEPATQDAMYEGLRAAYQTVAEELDARILPVGDAFHLANRDPQWGFRPSATAFDARNAKPGQLPDQLHSLNVGWNWKKGPDGKTMGITQTLPANT